MTHLLGSPPPMRGKGTGDPLVDHIAGITPAYAGKRRCSASEIAKIWDHPRLCGEKTLQSVEDTLKWGSPPPMRGKVNMTSIKSAACRITPAYAGKRFSAPLLLRLHRDHPRLCGEKVDCGNLKTVISGSPPPMRGKVAGAIGNFCLIGITPAYAGKSNWRP